MMTESKPKRSGKYHHNGNPKHRLFHDNAGLFNLWQTMKSRCENPRREKFKDYGDRGIKVCEEWQNASNFVLWALNNGYKKGLQLDRKNNDGDYCPNNCHFVTPKENSRNRRNTKFLVVENNKKCVAEWSEITGISPYTIYWWVREKGITYAEERLKNVVTVDVIEAWNRRADDA